MKIVILGLIAVAIVNVTLAAPSDKGGKDDLENETSKAQLDMVLEQMKQLRHQLQQQQEQQHLINKLMEEKQHLDEEQQEQLKEQQHRDEDQQEQLQVQQHQIAKIQRTQRSSGLSECAIGNHRWVNEDQTSAISTWAKISYGRTFSQKPKVIASVQGYWLKTELVQNPKSLSVTPWKKDGEITTTEFTLNIYIANYLFDYVDIMWIACVF